MEKAGRHERPDAFPVGVEYAAAASKSMVRGSSYAGIVDTYHDGITVETPSTESCREYGYVYISKKTVRGWNTAYLGRYLKVPPIAASRHCHITTEGRA